MKKSILKEYAKLIIDIGLNVQKGQNVLIFCGLDNPEFTLMCEKEAYRKGARRVFIKWNYQPSERLDYENCSEKTLSTLEPFEESLWKWRADDLPATLYIISDNPDAFQGVDQDKIANARMAKYPFIKPYREAMDTKYQWCIAAAPSKMWAKKIFPQLSAQKAVEKLWDAILSSSRALGNATDNWNKHNADLKNRCDHLNSLKLRSLHYTASNGTNLTVGLNENGLFSGGADKTVSGVKFNPNIPSEEAYTSPKCGVVDGIVYATKPLSYEGHMIENFSVRFSGGKAVEVKAEKNQKLLEKMINMDEGAAMLGECALVPFDSPINNSGILFYETLFDENACCHLALGRGFSECLKGYESMSAEELKKNGINQSMIHVDFMIGTLDLRIVGLTADGNEVVIFNNGNWAF